MDASSSSVSDSPSVGHIVAVLFRRFERFFAGLALFLASGAVLQGLLRAEGAAEDPVWIYFVWGTVYVITTGLAVIRRRRVRQILRVLRGELLLALLLLYTTLSVFWAADPVLTARRVVIFWGTTLIGLYLAARFSLYDIFRLTAWALFIAAILSALTIVFFPEIGLYEDPRTIGLQGVFGNKNTLGRAIGLGAAMSFFLWMDDSNANRRVWFFSFLIMSVITIFSQSKTSLVSFLSVLLLIPVFKTYRSRGNMFVVSITVSILLALFVSYILWTNWGYFLDLLGRGRTLSSRLIVWYSTGLMILEDPWLGHGYGADWLREVGSYGYLFTRYLEGWDPTHAHNGILQVAFEIGILGVLLLISHLFTFVRRSIRLIQRESSSYNAFLPIAFLVTLVGANATQTTIMSRNGIYWILYVAIALSLVKALDQDQPQ